MNRLDFRASHPIDGEVTDKNLIRDIANARNLYVQGRLAERARTDSRHTACDRDRWELEFVNHWNAEHPTLIALWTQCSDRLRKVRKSAKDPDTRPALAGCELCGARGPRVGEDGSVCTLPAGHLANPGAKIGTVGCRFTLDGKVIQDDSVRESVLFAPGSARPGPAVRHVRVLAVRRYDLDRGRYGYTEDHPDIGQVYACVSWSDGWITVDATGDGYHTLSFPNWQAMNAERVLVDVNGDVKA